MPVILIGHSVDLVRLVSALMLLLQAALLWLLAEPLMLRALPSLPVPRRTPGQRVVLYFVLAIEIVIAFVLMVAMDMNRYGPM